MSNINIPVPGLYVNELKFSSVDVNSIVFDSFSHNTSNINVANVVLLTERFIVLNSQQEAEVSHVLSALDDETVLVNEFGIPITRGNLKRLLPSGKLNDALINFYINLVKFRNDAICDKKHQRRSHFFDIFFLSKLLENDVYTYQNVKRYNLLQFYLILTVANDFIL